VASPRDRWASAASRSQTRRSAPGTARQEKARQTRTVATGTAVKTGPAWLKRIEGNFSSGDSVVVVDDVITTGGSTVQAIDAIEEAGGRVAFVLALMDREEGGGEN